MQARSFGSLKYFDVLQNNARVADGLQSLIQQRIEAYKNKIAQYSEQYKEKAIERIKLKADFKIKNNFQIPKGNYLAENTTTIIDGFGKKIYQIPTQFALQYSRKAKRKSMENLGKLLDVHK